MQVKLECGLGAGRRWENLYIVKRSLYILGNIIGDNAKCKHKEESFSF